MARFILIFVCPYFCNEIERCQLWKSLKYFSILWPMKHDVRFEYFPWKIVWFCSISIVWVPFSHKTDKFGFWKSVKCFNLFWLKKYDVRFEYVPWQNVWFCFICIAWVCLSHKTNFFICSQIFLYDLRFEYVLSNSVWFGLRFGVWGDFWQ